MPSTEVVDLNQAGVDIGIRVGEDADMGSGADRLLAQRVFPVCSPDLAFRLERCEDLRNIPIIRENERLYGWQSWLAGRELQVDDLQAGPTYADASLCLDAAMTGQGVFMAWETLACDALERGLVAAPFAGRSETGATYWFATSEYGLRKPSVRNFQKWLKAELACSVQYWNAQTG